MKKKSNKGQAGKKKTGIARILFPLLTLICLAGFIGSLIFPNEVLDTYKVNMNSEEGELLILLPLSYAEPICYKLDTAGRPMKGVQLGISKRGQQQTGQYLSYDVYAEDQLVSENLYHIAEGTDLQYVYLPFQNDAACKGKLRIELKLTQDSGELPLEKRPALEANYTQIEGMETQLYPDCEILPETKGDNEDSAGKAPSLRGSHIYTHNTYPFLYDFRILTFVFLAVSMTLPLAGRERRPS